MALSEHFEQKTEGLVSTLHELVDDNQPWRKDLEDALSAIHLTEEQNQVIRDAATSLTFKSIGHDEGMDGFSTRMTHAFRDAIGNSTMVLEMAAMMEDEQGTLNALVQIRGYIEDLRHNYPLILKEDMPTSVQGVLDRYEEDVLPEINELISELSQTTGIDPSTIPQNLNYQHITTLPDDAFHKTITNE